MADQARERGRVALHRRHRLRELPGAAAAHPEEVDLLLRQAADPQRHLRRGHTDLNRPARRGDHVDHRPDRVWRPGGVDRDRRPGRPRPSHARVRTVSSRDAPQQTVGAQFAARAPGADSCRSTTQHLGPALQRQQAQALADRPRAEHHHPLAAAQSGARQRPDGDRHWLGHRRHRRIVGVHREHLLLRQPQAAAAARRRGGCRSARTRSHVFGRPTLHG